MISDFGTSVISLNLTGQEAIGCPIDIYAEQRVTRGRYKVCGDNELWSDGYATCTGIPSSHVGVSQQQNPGFRISKVITKK